MNTLVEILIRVGLGLGIFLAIGLVSSLIGAGLFRSWEWLASRTEARAARDMEAILWTILVTVLLFMAYLFGEAALDLKHGTSQLHSIPTKGNP